LKGDMQCLGQSGSRLVRLYVFFPKDADRPLDGLP